MKRKEFNSRLKEYLLLGVLSPDPPPGDTVLKKRRTHFFGYQLYYKLHGNKRGDRIVGVELKGPPGVITDYMRQMKILVLTTKKGRAKLKREGYPHLTPNQFFKLLKMLARGELKY